MPANKSLFFPFLYFLNLFFNLFYSPDYISLLVHPPIVPHPIPPPFIPIVPTPHPSRPPHSLWPPVSWGLGASSVIESRSSIPLLYMCWWPHISWYMLCLVGGSVSKRSGGSRLLRFLVLLQGPLPSQLLPEAPFYKQLLIPFEIWNILCIWVDIEWLFDMSNCTDWEIIYFWGHKGITW